MNYKGYPIKTIADLEQLYYSNAGAMLINKDAPVLSTTNGVYKPIYGAQVWASFNREANALGISPKTVWTNSGWRVMTARPAANGGGIAENGNLPATIKPSFYELSTKPKTIAHTFDVSEVQEFLVAEAKDDGTGDMEVMRPIIANHHKEMMNLMLLGDADTVAGYNLESYDRIISSRSEEAGCLTAGDADIYGIDRSDAAYSWADAQVSHNSNTDRILTDDLLRTMIRSTIPNAGGSTSFALTGNDTLSEIESMYATQARYNRNDALGTSDVQLTVNGVQSAKGINVGIKVTSVYQIPIFTSKDVVKDTLSRIYFVDSSNPEGFTVPRISLDVAKPTQYFEAGMSQGTPFPIDRFGNEGMYRTMAEIKCRFFGAQGKIRDLKSI
jgi:hypothetical protein